MGDGWTWYSRSRRPTREHQVKPARSAPCCDSQDRTLCPRPLTPFVAQCGREGQINLWRLFLPKPLPFPTALAQLWCGLCTSFSLALDHPVSRLVVRSMRVIIPPNPAAIFTRAARPPLYSKVWKYEAFGIRSTEHARTRAPVVLAWLALAAGAIWVRACLRCQGRQKRRQQGICVVGVGVTCSRSDLCIWYCTYVPWYLCT